MQHFHHAPGVRQEQMSLKGERVSHLHMEALEEIFRRVQFDSLDFEYTFLDDDVSSFLQSSAHGLEWRLGIQQNDWRLGFTIAAI